MHRLPTETDRALTHGCEPWKLYQVWANMRQRCSNPNARSFKDYGGRGIYICAQWLDNFTQFRDWSLANGYADGLTIDRIDNDGPYSPGNCCWVTGREQSRNKRTTRSVEFRGQAGLAGRSCNQVSNPDRNFVWPIVKQMAR